jgi:hypothetical protein
LHTTDGCSVGGSDQVATLVTTNCYIKENDNSGCGSRLDATTIPNNYGKPLNDNGGGVYVTEWTANYVKTWFFPRGAIPSSITSGSPDISQFGKPTVNQQGPGCTIEDHFANMSIIINTDFCGDWAGNVYGQFQNCPQNPAISSSWDRCVDYVGNNPTAFTEAYWDFNSIRVYQMPPGVEPVSSYSTSLASTQPLSSTNTINAGMGRSSSSMSSPGSYTGPLSSLTPSLSLSDSKPTTASPEPSPPLPSDEDAYWSSYWALHSTTTPIISFQPSSTQMDSSTPAPSSSACPSMDNQLITAPGGRVYRLYCSSDTSGEAGGIITIQDFPAGQDYDSCFNLCSAESSCTAFTWQVGVNGGGTCVVKRNAQYPAANPERPDLWSFILVTGTSGPDNPASPSPTASTCQDGSVLNGSNGRRYTLFCPGDTTGATLDSAQYGSGDYTQCVTLCDANSACGAWTWVPYPLNRGGVCYLKSGPQTRTAASNDGSVGATLISGDVHSTTSSNVPGGAGGVTSSIESVSVAVIDTPPTSSAQTVPTAAPCPYANGTEYVSSSGRVYEVICYMDEASNPASSAYVAGDYGACVTECEQTVGCVSVTYSAFNGGGTGGFCSFRKSIGPLTPSDNSDVHLNLIPGKASSVGPTTTTTTTQSSSVVSSSALTVSSILNSISSISVVSSIVVTPSPINTPSISLTSISSDVDSPSMTMSEVDTPVSTSTGDNSKTDGTSTASASVTKSITSSSISSSASISLSSVSRSTSLPSSSPSTKATLPGTSTGLSSTISSSVLSASSSALPDANPACDTVFKDPSGQSYLIKCSTDSTGTSFRTAQVYSGGFGTCFGACDSTQGCTGFTYVGNDIGNCYLKQMPGTLFTAPSSSFITAFKLSALSSSASQVSSTSASSSLLPGASISTGSSSASASASSIGSMSVSPRATTSSAASSSGMSSSTSSSRSSSVSYAPPPACPTSSSYYCMEEDQQTTCSSGNNNYAIQCGILYQGTEIDTSDINEVPPTDDASQAEDDSGTSAMSGSDDTSAANATSAMITKISKRATLPNVASCRALCDRTTGCKAFNFVGTNCTLFSSVTGYSYAPGALGGTVYAQGTAPPTPVDTSPSCPASAGKTFTDSMSMTYNIVCYTQYASGYTSDAPFASDNLANCLPTCSKNAQCAGVAFDTTTRLCQLLTPISGAQTTNNNLIVALRVGGPPAYGTPSSVPPTTLTTTLLPTSTLCKFSSIQTLLVS